MVNSYTMCLCILVAVQAVSCHPEGRLNPMIAKKIMERSISISPSSEASISREPYDSVELAPTWLIPGDDTPTGEAASLSPHHRVRRQSFSMGLGLRRHDNIWASRNVGTLHGHSGVNIGRNNRNNYHANMGAGMSMFG